MTSRTSHGRRGPVARAGLASMLLSVAVLAACAPAPTATDPPRGLAAVQQVDGPSGASVVEGGAITASSEGGSLDVNGESLAIVDASDRTVRVGTPATSKPHEISPDGIVAPGPGGTEVVTRIADDGGAQALIVISDAAAPNRYEFPVEVPGGSATLTAQQDGSVTIGDGPEVLATAAPAWALDANGDAVPTRYEIDNGTLVQIVEHGDGTAYPVVADPKVSFGWRIYVKFNKSEAKTIGRSPITSRARYGAIACAALVKPVLAAACAMVAQDVLQSVSNTFRSAAKNGRCVELAYLPTGPLVGWKTYKC